MSNGPAIQQTLGLSTSMAAFIVTLREYLRDRPELNRLIAGEESSDRFLLFAAGAAIKRFNGTPPATHYGLDSLIQLEQLDILIQLAVIVTLESVMLLQARNQLSYSTGGTSVAVNDKAGLYLKLLQYFRAVADQELLRRKVALNLLSILGDVGVHSEYALLHSSYTPW